MDYSAVCHHMLKDTTVYKCSFRLTYLTRDTDEFCRDGIILIIKSEIERYKAPLKYM